MSGVRNSSTIAIKLATEGGKSLAEAARDLDLGERLLRGCKQPLAQGSDHALPGKDNSPALREQTRLINSGILEDFWLAGRSSERGYRLSPGLLERR